MGQICCSTCITAYHGLDIADDISIQLKDMIFKISWGNIPYSKLLIKLNDETKKKIAVNIAKYVKEKKIAVSNFNGFVTNYIAINIAGFIFHKFIWDVLYPHELEKDPGFQYPAYVPMEVDYKDVFTNKVVDKYINDLFITQDRFVCFVEQFKKQRKLEEYNIEYGFQGEKYEIRDTLRKWQLQHPNASMAITGWFTITRGLTFNTNGFNFTDVIISPYHAKQMKELEKNTLDMITLPEIILDIPAYLLSDVTTDIFLNETTNTQHVLLCGGTTLTLFMLHIALRNPVAALAIIHHSPSIKIGILISFKRIIDFLRFLTVSDLPSTTHF